MAVSGRIGFAREKPAGFDQAVKSRNVAMLVPVGAFALIALLYLEAGHQAIPMFNPPQMNFEALLNPEAADELSSGELITDSPVTADAVLHSAAAVWLRPSWLVTVTS